MTCRLTYWPENDSNPYQRLFYGALEPYGIETVRGLTISDDALRSMRPRIDVIHFHWPEYIWRINVPNAWVRARRIEGFRRFLDECHRLGLCLIWTAHNLQPHEAGWMDRIGIAALGKRSDLIITHGDDATATIRRRYGRPTVTMPHGNYDGAYPPPRARETVLREVGLSTDLPTMVMAGGLRRYKGVDQAIAAVARLGGRVQLLLGGQPQEQVDVSEYETLARQHRWLAILPRALNPQEFADLIGAGAGVLLPYLKVTTSGALLSAWTMSRGVVCSPEPYFTKLLAEHPGAGVVARSLSPEDFAAAIERFLEVSEEERSGAARRAADAYSWATCVVPVAEALKTLALKTRRSG